MQKRKTTGFHSLRGRTLGVHTAFLFCQATWKGKSAAPRKTLKAFGNEE